MDLFTALDTRASALKLAEPPPTREHLERIIGAGGRAPDHGRLAPWRFVVIGDQARTRLGEILVQDLLARDSTASAAAQERERNKVGRAPCIIAAAARVTTQHKVPAGEQLLAVGAAVQNMFLAAHALGYGVMWKTGAAAYSPQVKQLLGLNFDDQLVGLLHLGSNAMPGTPRGAVLDERVTWLA